MNPVSEELTLPHERNSIIKLYEMLSQKLGKDSAENLTLYIENKIKEDLENKTQVATKEGPV